MSADTVTGVILAGGQSRRFGSDKALFEIDGMSLVQRAYQTLTVVSSSLFVSVASSGTRYNVPAKHLVDTPGYAGPLAGIQAALQTVQSGWVVVLAVDLPYVTPAHLRLLVEARTAQTDAVIARTKDRTHPLCACYHTRTLPLLEDLLNQKTFKVSAFADQLRVAWVQFTPPEILINLNTPPTSTRNTKHETRNRSHP